MTTAAQLIDAHRRAQSSIAGTAASQTVVALRTLLVPGAIDRTFPLYLSAFTRIVNDGRHASSATAGAFYTSHREAMGVLGEAPKIALAGAAPAAQLATSALVTGPIAMRKALAAGATAEQARNLVAAKAAGAAYRLTANAGRDTIDSALHADRRAVGWARVTDGRPCAFCAMLASRGPVYKSQATAWGERRKYHDGCGCVPVPVYDLNAPWPGNGRQYQTLWNSSTVGKSGDDAIRAFRRALEGRTAAIVEPQPDWKSELKTARARIPRDRSGLGKGPLITEEIRTAHIEAQAQGIREELAALTAKLARVRALKAEMERSKAGYWTDTEVPAALAKRIRTEGFKTTGGMRETYVRLNEYEREWHSFDVNRLERELADIEWRAPRVGTHRGLDLEPDGELGEHTASALDGVLQTGRIVDEEITRRLKARGVDLDTLNKRAADAVAAFEREMRRKHDIYEQLMTEARKGSPKKLPAWPAEGWDRVERRLEQLTAESPEYLRAVAAVQKARLAMREAQDAVEGTYRRAYAETAREVLAEVRPMGGGILRYSAEGARAEELKAAMRYGESAYPREWLERVKAAEPNIHLSIEARGYNRTGEGKIVLSEARRSVITGGVFDRVATHELGHSIENALPELRALEWAFHYTRSTVVRDGRRRLADAEALYGDTSEKFGKEVGIRDEWSDAYTGKQYGVHRPDAFWEVFTTGVESLFDGSSFMDRKGVLGGDIEFRRFVLGVLGGL